MWVAGKTRIPNPNMEKMVGDCELRPQVKMTNARLVHIEFHSNSTVTLACGSAHLSIIASLLSVNWAIMFSGHKY